jgi:hypothetical protein
MQRLALIVLVVFLAACGGGEAETTTTSSDVGPVEVAAAWLDAMNGSDATAIEPLVEPVGLAIIAAVENNLRSDELVGLLESGMSPDLATRYWATFHDAFGAIQGESLEDVSVGDPIQIPDSRDRTAVAIATGRTEGRVILLRTEAGWKVDFAATVGPALVGPLGRYLASAMEGEHAGAIAGAYNDAIVPALEAAFALDRGNSNLEFETEYIRQLANTDSR